MAYPIVKYANGGKLQPGYVVRKSNGDPSIVGPGKIWVLDITCTQLILMFDKKL
jgi:hypothetical protein